MQKLQILPLNLLQRQGDESNPSDDEIQIELIHVSTHMACHHSNDDIISHKQQIRGKLKYISPMIITDQLQKWNLYLTHKFKPKQTKLTTI